MPVISEIYGGMLLSGFTSVWYWSMILLPSNTTIAISVILSRVESPPVVSISTMAYLRSVCMRYNLPFLSMGLLISMFFIICQGCAQPATHTFSNPQGIAPGAWSTEEYIPLISRQKVGIVVNHTSLIGETHLVDTLVSRGINVVKIFAPEHGLRGKAEAGAHIADSIDE